MTKRILVGNWKMNLGPKEAGLVAHRLASLAVNLKKTEIWLAPSAFSLQAVLTAAAGSPINIGAQNTHWRESGAFTGENSAAAAKELGAGFVIAGHSERRHVFHEPPEESAERAAFALNLGLSAIFCVGEKLEDRESGRAGEVVSAQLSHLFRKLGDNGAGRLIIAYEPVWAIGTGRNASAQEISEAHGSIKSLLKKNLGSDAAPILYGGSVVPDNIAEILRTPLVSGCLIGGASLDIGKWEAMIADSEAI